MSSFEPVGAATPSHIRLGAVVFGHLDAGHLPLQVRFLLNSLATAMKAREPAIRARVEVLRAIHPLYTNDQLARELIRSTRRRVAATGALSGATAIAPGLGTLLAIGTVTSQTLYAFEQETELVLGIAMIYGHELVDSEDRLLEALAVIGIAGGALQLRDGLLVAGGRFLADRLLTRILSRSIASRLVRVAGRVIPLGIGVAAGAGFDWASITALGRAAARYYGPGGPRARPLLLAAEDPSHVEPGG